MTGERRALGARGEDAAVAYLERIGMTVAERNWRCPAGEIDIVALDGTTIVLCEVKTRRTASKGTAEESVTLAKQRRYANGPAHPRAYGLSKLFHLRHLREK